jgi:hypothetical protein
MNINIFDLVSGVLGFIFTLMILSYLIGDNPLFRVAVYLFAGVSAGVVAVMAWNNIIWPQLVAPLLSGAMDRLIFLAVPLFLSVLLLTKLSKPMARLGNISMAFMVGAGAAVVVSGALTGTLIPQIVAAISLPNMGSAFGDPTGTQLQYLIEGAVALLATIAALIYFQFGVRAQAEGKRGGLMRILALIGQVFIGITLGAIFAGTYAAAVTALIERVYAFMNLLRLFFVF